MPLNATLNTPTANATFTAPAEFVIDVTVEATGQSSLSLCIVSAWHGPTANDPGAGGYTSANIGLNRDPNNPGHFTSATVNVPSAGDYKTRIWTVETVYNSAAVASMTVTGGGPLGKK